MKKLLKNTISLIMIISIIGITMVTPTLANESESYPLIFEWDDIETINAHLDDTPMTLSTVPTAVDLTSDFPTPGDQGSQGSCTAWAVAYALKSNLENTKRGWSVNADSHKFSPSFVYNQLTNNGDGIRISDAMELLKDEGVCSLNYFPYDATDYSTQPSSIVNAAASLYKISHWNTIKGITTIKNHLASGNGVVVGIKVYPDFTNISSTNQIYDNTDGTYQGAHAICLIGYDDTKQAFKFINSWGTSWGLGGYGWISYDLLESTTVNLYGEAVGYVMYNATDDYLLGDVNEDGSIDTSDAMLVLQYVVNSITLSDRALALADTDGDAAVTTVDYSNILNFTVENIDKMPLYE